MTCMYEYLHIYKCIYTGLRLNMFEQSQSKHICDKCHQFFTMVLSSSWMVSWVWHWLSHSHHKPPVAAGCIPIAIVIYFVPRRGRTNLSNWHWQQPNAIKPLQHFPNQAPPGSLFHLRPARPVLVAASFPRAQELFFGIIANHTMGK